MSKKFKSVIVILLLTAFCLGLAGCQAITENSENEAPASEASSTASDAANEAESTDGTGAEAESVDGGGVITVTDYAGREVVIEKYAERIVDLTYLDGVRILVELGAQDTLVGMSNMDHDIFDTESGMSTSFLIVPKVAPELKDITNVGDYKEPNAQLVMSLEPDVVFMQKDMGELADTLQKQINIPVVCIGGDGSLDFELYRLAGQIVGKEERAEELIAFAQEKIRMVTDTTDNIPENEKPRVFFWVRPMIGDPRTSGDYAPLQLAGALNVAADTVVKPHESYKITLEQIAAWNPEIIFKHTFRIKTDVEGQEEGDGWRTIESILNDPVLQGVQAIEESKVYPTKAFMRGWDPATGVTEVLYLAKILHPDKFSDLDVEAEGNKILEKFYGLDGLYTEMTDSLDLYSWE